MTAPIVFIDTETLGLDPDHHPVWEIGLILPDGRECCWQVKVTPRELSLAHPIALQIGRFEERYKESSALGAGVVAYHLHRLIPDGAHLAGAVVSFDEERLRRLMWRWDFAPPWHYHLIDVEALAAGWLASRWRGYEDSPNEDARAKSLLPLPPWDSNALSLAVGVDPERFDRHTALGDAKWAKAIYDAVMS